MLNAFLPITPEEVTRASEEILASEVFAGAPLMCRLLRFLVAKATRGERSETTEYAIGIEVFDRKPSQYSTAEDPSVRVQVGRLRKRLQTYYATRQSAPEIEISIPLGSYMPVIRRPMATRPVRESSGVLALHTIECIDASAAGHAFTQGLREELVHRLFKAFGTVVVTPRFLSGQAAASGAGQGLPRVMHGVEQVIEGSIRMDAQRVRASIHLLDVSRGGVSWSQQFDRARYLAIGQQEELADAICAALKQHFERQRPAPGALTRILTGT